MRRGAIDRRTAIVSRAARLSSRVAATVRTDPDMVNRTATADTTTTIAVTATNRRDTTAHHVDMATATTTTTMATDTRKSMLISVRMALDSDLDPVKSMF